MRLAASLNTLRSNRQSFRDELTIPSQPVPHTFAQGTEVRLAVHTDDSPMLLLPVSTEELRQSLPSAAGIEVEFARYHGRKTSSAFFAQIKCAAPELEGVFLDLVENICERIRSGDQSLIGLAAAIEQFRDLLRAVSQPADRTRMIGLFGELLILEQSLSSAGNAVEYWTGPIGGRRDFLFPSCAIEAKTTLISTGYSVSIHSLNQLDSDDTTHLYLWFQRIEEDPGRGRSIGEVVAGIEDRVSDRSLLHERLRQVGFDHANPEPWNQVKWTLVESQPYAVLGTFPRIVPASFPAGPPAGIFHVTYQLDLAQAVDFKVSIASVLEALNT